MNILIGISRYSRNWSDIGNNGVVYYDYYKITDWKRVGEIATGAIVIAGVTCLVILAPEAAPVLIPGTAALLGG
jgi:hypothetical protein